MWVGGGACGHWLTEGLEASHRPGPGQTQGLCVEGPPTATICSGQTFGVQATLPPPPVLMCPPWPLLQDELTDLALPCTVSGMKEPLVLGISGKPQGLQVSITISPEGTKRR